MTTTFQIREDDLTDETTRALVALHLKGVHASSPPGFSFALDLSGLKTPDMTVWTAREAMRAIGMGALKDLGGGHGEVKSMRTHPDHLRRGIAAQVLEHMISQARARGWTRLSLETGTGPIFEPALCLYRRHGFVDGEAFADYEPSPFNQFLHRSI